jgi:predicted Fe-S protein YdhL (DUF1289 family)
MTETKSMCVKVCEYEEGTNVCQGCGRTAEEITEWLYATKERKIEIAKAVRSRSKERRRRKTEIQS